MHPDDRDLLHLRAALQAAQASIGLSDPNPRVGCVIVGDGWTAEGHTQAAGGPHAEVVALRAAAAAGRELRGATVYVTLEPCAHHGRTPPCCDALIAAGVGRVVVAVGDPNPRVAGQGLARLRAAGIAVDLAADLGIGELADAARELNIGFFSRMQRGRPWVRVKVATSLDGRTALANGASQWLTGEAARADGHAWRRRAGAVLSGIGTVLADDPRLDVRHVATARQPLRVVVDSRLQTPPTARLLSPPGAVLIYHAIDDAVAPTDHARRAAALRAQGAELVGLPDAHGKVDLVAMLHDLGRRGINELHVEAGDRLNASLLATGQVDELLVYLAPRLLGAGRGIAALGPFERLADAPTLRWHAVDRVGDDLRLLARLPAAQPPDSPVDAADQAGAGQAATIAAMFTGIVSAIGRIVGSSPLGSGREHGRRLVVETPAGWLAGVAVGDSIAINGACMTVTTLDAAASRFTVDVSAESLARTAGLAAAGPVNLEQALRAGDRLGGHLVSGHVDGIGTVTGFEPVGESRALRVLAPRELARYLAVKGSVTVDGVSLTVNRLDDRAEGCELAVNLVPHTQAQTTLGALAPGAAVNLEVDLIARHLERLLRAA